MFDTKLLTDNGVNLEKSLELFGDMETYNDTIKEFQQELGSKLEKIKEEKEQADMPNYAINVHSLKSDARYFGFEVLGNLAYDHEMKSKANDIAYVNEHFDELMNEANKTLRIVNEYLGMNESEHTPEKEEMTKEKSILVVDDSNVISAYLSNIFSDDFNIYVSSDGDDAISKLSDRSLNIKLMLLDINLPTVNGYEVLEFMKVNNINDINVAVVTGNDSSEVVEKVSGYNVGVIVEKPFNETSIKSAVDNLLK
jgi:CheY-like chemotaxis protein